MNSKTFWGNLLVLGALAFVFLAAYWLHPDPRGLGTHEQLFLPPCWFHWLTGIPCPSCGLTTSFAFLAKGDVWNGIRVHPLGPVLFLLAALGFVHAAVSLVRRRPSWTFFERPSAFWATMILMSALMITWAIKISTQERTWIAIRSIL